MVIELRVVQFWSEIILVISNRTRAARSFDFEITRMICIGNHMISSAIWDKSARVNFSKANQIARARRASAICGL